MKLSLGKVLCLSALICSFSVFAKNKIIPTNQLKLAPVVSQDMSPEMQNDNYQENFQDNQEDLAYLDKDLPTQVSDNEFVEENAIKVEETQDNPGPEYQN